MCRNINYISKAEKNEIFKKEFRHSLLLIQIQQKRKGRTFFITSGQ